jgi:hypothetical protein
MNLPSAWLDALINAKYNLAGLRVVHEMVMFDSKKANQLLLLK